MVTALVTLYNPDDHVQEHIKTISSQVDRVILCDNSLASHKNMFTGLSNVDYVFNGKNLAISGAFNKILRNKAYKWENNEYVIFFDQDSFIREGHVERLIKEYEDLSLHYHIGCIGPLYYDRNDDTVPIPRVKKQVNEYSYIIDNNITSSLLCQYGRLADINFWNENIFLDMADWDLCWRFIQKGYICFRTKCVLLSHTRGDGEIKVAFLRITKGNPSRIYYQTRNCIYLLKEKYTPARFKLRFIVSLFMRPIAHLVFLDQKTLHLKYWEMGIRDALNGKKGEYQGQDNRMKGMLFGCFRL